MVWKLLHAADWAIWLNNAFAPERFTKNARLHAQARSRYLHVDIIRRDRVAQNDRQADYSFIADRPDLGRGTIHHGVDDGGDAGDRKIDERNRLSGPIELEFVVQRHLIEMRAEPIEVIGGKELKPSIPPRLKWL